MYVRQHRQDVLAAALTLCRAWFAAGCPEPQSPKLGSFERWSTVLGGVLEVAQVKDFLADLSALYADADDETPEWEAFLVALQSLFGSKDFTVSRIIDDLELFTRSALGATLPGALGDAFDSKRGVRQRFGRELKAHLGARYGNPPLHLEGGYDKHSSQYMYKVVPG
jgi:hypothetical protein